LLRLWLCVLWTVTKLEPGVMEYWLTKCQLLAVHGTTKQLMDCRYHLLSLLPDSDVSSYMEIVRELVKVTGAVYQLCVVFIRALTVFHLSINIFSRLILFFEIILVYFVLHVTYWRFCCNCLVCFLFDIFSVISVCVLVYFLLYLSVTYLLLLYMTISYCCVVVSCWPLFQWYNESGDVDKAISIMMKALEKHSTAITAGGWFLCPLVLYSGFTHS